MQNTQASRFIPPRPYRGSGLEAQASFRLQLGTVMLGALLSLATPSFVSAAPVEVTNTPLPVTDVDHAAHNRFQAQTNITTLANGTITTNSFARPANIVVIEFVSGTCETNSATRILQLGIQTIAAGVTVTHGLALTLLFSDSTTHYYAVSQQARIYSDPSTNIILTRHLLTSAPEVINCSIAISGYSTP